MTENVVEAPIERKTENVGGEKLIVECYRRPAKCPQGKTLSSRGCASCRDLQTLVDHGPAASIRKHRT